MKTYDSNYALGKPFGCMTTVNKNTPYEYEQGHYNFKHGTVRIYQESGYVALYFVYKGRYYSRTMTEINKPLSSRSLMIYAGKFAREIVKSVES